MASGQLCLADRSWQLICHVEALFIFYTLFSKSSFSKAFRRNCLSDSNSCPCLTVSLFLSVSIFVYFFLCLSVCLSVSLPVCLSLSLSLPLSCCLFLCLSFCLSVSLSVCLSLCLFCSSSISLFL